MEPKSVPTIVKLYAYNIMNNLIFFKKVWVDTIVSWFINKEMLFLGTFEIVQV